VKAAVLNGQTLAYVYGHTDPRDAQIANGLTLDEARRIASNIAKLPTLLGKVLPDDAVNNLSDERHQAEDTTDQLNYVSLILPTTRIRPLECAARNVGKPNEYPRAAIWRSWSCPGQFRYRLHRQC